MGSGSTTITIEQQTQQPATGVLHLRREETASAKPQQLPQAAASASSSPTQAPRELNLEERVQTLVLNLQRSHLFTPEIQAEITEWARLFAEKHNDPDGNTMDLCYLLCTVINPAISRYADNEDALDEMIDFSEEIEGALAYIMGSDVDIKAFIQIYEELLEEKRSFDAQLNRIEATFQTLQRELQDATIAANQEQMASYEQIRGRLRHLNSQNRQMTQDFRTRLDSLTARVNAMTDRLTVQKNQVADLGDEMKAEQNKVSKMIQGFYE